MNFSESVKQVLLEKIHEMAACPGSFVRNPGSDFTRTRKLDFETTIRCLIAMESGSLKKELLELFSYNPDTATASAFNQQREKILPEALEFLFREFSKAFAEYQTYRGYRLFACDGTDLNIARNPSDHENYFRSKPSERGFNQLHLNALYDLCSRRYVDAVIQPGRKTNEYRAMADMIDRCVSGHKTYSLPIAAMNLTTFLPTQNNGMCTILYAQGKPDVWSITLGCRKQIHLIRKCT